jgi:predicted hydrocarbon binding protein
MKGIVFDLLEEIVVSEHGAETWDLLIDRAGVKGIYTSLGNYPDAELTALVVAAADALDLPADDVVRWFGRNAMPIFAERYEPFFTPHSDVRSFVLTLNEIIHPEVQKLYPGAETPTFAFDASQPGSLALEYRSPRKLCAFAEGLLHGAADVYGQTLEIEQPECMNRGDQRCLIEISISG